MRAMPGWTVRALLLVLLTVSMLHVVLESTADRMGAAVAETFVDATAMPLKSR